MNEPIRESCEEFDVPTIWGLQAIDLHMARWRSRGVQTVSRGIPFDKVGGAELYLLLEPTQMVVFDLSEIAESMIWNRAVVTRVRIIESGEEDFREQVVLDDSGFVKRIQRYYVRDSQVRFRVLLTRSAAVASVWAGSSTRRGAWIAMREIAGRRTASERVHGHCFDMRNSVDDRELINHLVATWVDPSRAIEGVEEIQDGIWGVSGTRLAKDAVCTAPAWVGYAPRAGQDEMLAGPAWSEDDSSVIPGSVPVRLLAINEIMPPENASRNSNFGGRQFYGLFKRIADSVISGLVLLFSLPFILLIAIAILIDDGRPIFFGHKRQSRNGEGFRCWKFRTMRRDAETMVAQLRKLDHADGPQVFIKNDPRVTRVGKVLRKYHLDEIPQFFNVLMGEMSLVGPRPSPERENQFCPAWRELRLSVRPGITGLWQVERTRAPGKDFQEWIRYDIEYVRHASLRLDFLICMKTMWNIVLRG